MKDTQINPKPLITCWSAVHPHGTVLLHIPLDICVPTMKDIQRE